MSDRARHSLREALATQRAYAITRLASVALALVIWQIVGSRLNPVFLSTPVAIASALVDIFRTGVIIEALRVSLVALAIGFSAAVVIGVVTGVMMARSRLVNAALEWFVSFGIVTPRVALIPLMLIWFGLGFTSQVVIIFLSAVFPIILNTYAGVRSISSNLVDVGRAFCATERQLLTEILLPAAVPFIMMGVRLGVARAVVGMIVAQMFLALSGLGKLLVEYGNFFRTDYVFAVVIVISVLGMVLQWATEMLEKRFAHWKESERAFA